MPKRHEVNLDAMIRRDDFEGMEDQPSPTQSGGNMKLSELESGSILFQMLRKPDFQRETKNWSPEKIAELIRGFVDYDLIPSIIMWRSERSGNIFVIDGAHRLSAYIAWIHDDYGDKTRSLQLFGTSLSTDERKAADKTRDLIRKTVGTYADLKHVAQHPDSGTPEQIRRAKNAGVRAVELQWVTGDASKAEASFFTINMSGTAIDPTELRIIRARRKPNAIAARGIMRAGTGHKYWSEFVPAVRKEIEDLSREVYDILFAPSLETPIKTLDVPVAGRGYSPDSLSLVVEFINVANNLKTEMWLDEPQRRKRGSDGTAPLPDDKDGMVTIEYLKTVRRIATRLSGNLARSLGLHPAVYFYSATGRYQPTAFLAMVSLVKEMEASDTFVRFTEQRYRFEEFLVKYKYFINQIVKNYGSGTKGLEAMLTMFRMILDGVARKQPDQQIVIDLCQHDRLKFLKVMIDEDRTSGEGDFSGEAKNAAFIRTALEEGGVRCAICRARIHVKGLNIDHKRPKREGGGNDSTNGQVTHPFCNSLKDEKSLIETKTHTVVI